MTTPGDAPQPDWAWRDPETGAARPAPLTAQAGGTSAAAVVGAVFLGLWLVIVAFASQAIGFLINQVLLATGLDSPVFLWPLISVIILIFGFLPALAVARLARSVAIRETGRVWSAGAAALTVGTAWRAVPGTQNEWYLLGLALLAGAGALLLRRKASPRDRDSWPWAVAGGLLVLAPFLWAGALGGWLETAFAIAAAIAVGALAASTLDGRFWSVFGPGRVRAIVLGGLTGGVSLALIGAASGGDGVQLLLLLVLPPLAFAAAALRHIRLLATLAALGPLALFDPVEVNFFLVNQDIPYWAMLSALVAWAVAAIVSVCYGFTAPLLSRVRRPFAIGTATVLAVAAGAFYFAGGQPGFFGNQLFVVLKEQASLSSVPATAGPGPGRDQRVSRVYETLVEHADRTQAPLRAELGRLGLGYRPYYLVNAVMVTGGPEVRAWLELRDDVDRVLLDQRLRPLPEPVPPARGDLTTAPPQPQWNIEMVGAPEVWAEGTRGQGIVVGGSDSGVDGRHPALAAGYRGGGDSWFDPWDGSAEPVDKNGHGTHTLATAVGTQQVGVAPGAQWVGCVNLDRNMASPSFYLDCMQFMLAPFPLGGNPFRDGNPARAPHVLTNSWGCPALEGCDEGLTRPATDALAAAGIAFVAAAGNTGDRCGSIEEPPAIDPAVFTVAAVDAKGSVAVFSSRGQVGSAKPDAAAPGEDVLSAMPGGTYGKMSGTSMATPHVAGLIALMWSAQPSLIGDLPGTYERLRSTAVPASGGFTCGGPRDTGAGIVNAPGAVG
jgi:hypothetical protein